MLAKYHGNRHGNPPSEWPRVGAAPLGGDVYWRFDPDMGPDGLVGSILVWHWCTRQPPDPDDVEAGRWAAANVASHTLVSIDPLHLEPSLLWDCCGKHGFVRAGAWSDA